MQNTVTDAVDVHGVTAEEAAALPHAAQLRRGFRSLGFEPSLEWEFREYYWTGHRRIVRVGVICGALLFALFGLRDFLTLPSEVSYWTVMIRMGVMVPCLLAAIPLTYSATLPRHYLTVIWAMIFGVIGGLTAVILVADAMGHPLPYESLLLVIIFVYYLSGIRFFRAAVTCIAASLAYVLISQYYGVTDGLLTRIYYLAATNIIGLFGGYSYEHLQRRIFLTEKLAEFRANRDALTLLPNRRAFAEHLDRVWRQAQRENLPVSVIAIDVDHFKAYNDFYGHNAGDRALSSVGHALSDSLRRPLDMVSRYGGEEFLAIAYGVGPRDLHAVCESLRLAVVALDIAHAAPTAARRITVSIGAAAAYPADQTAGRQSLLHGADRALYRAKENGRNCTEIEESLSMSHILKDRAADR